MARYTGSKTKLSKRVGRNLFLKGARSFSQKDDYSKRPYKAGMHGGGKSKFAPKVSQYGRQLLEKQAIRFTYGLVEKQLANLFKKAFVLTGDTGKNVLGLLERRLDNVVYRAGLANSRNQARQLVNHGHFMVDGVSVNIPSYIVAPGEVVTIKASKVKSPFWETYALQTPNEVPAWLDTSKKHEIKVLNNPLETDLPQDFKISAVVEYYSRKVR
jgi:small subunit ribosomal protein S4